MSVIQNNLLLAGDDAYNIQRSLRFRSSASAYLNRTPASAGNRRTWTYSAWIKFGDVSTNGRQLFGTLVTSSYTVVGINSSGQGTVSIGLESVSGTTTVIGRAYTNAVYRDPSAWYHVVIQLDTTQATGSDRFKVYINGVQQTLTFSTTPSQNSDHFWNQASVSQALMAGYSTAYCCDGYLAEVNFIDGQALTPSSFGQSSPTTGVWQPKKYTGTYGTNGFYLPFTNNSTTTTLGNDFSGNGNNWTANNISLTAGATYDSMTDVPTLTSATQANFAVLNPLARTSSSMTIQDGNLTTTQSATGLLYLAPSSMVLPTSGKFYAEFRLTSTVLAGNGGPVFGIAQNQTLMDTGYGNNGKTVGYYNSGTNGVTYRNGTNATGVSGLAPLGGDIVQVAVDCATGNVWLGKNNVWYGGNSGVPTAIGDPSAGTNPIVTLSSTDIASGYVFFVAISDQIQTNGWTVNFGQRPFAYTPPTGFVALNTFNLPTPTIGATASTQANKYMDVSLYTGNGSTQSITNSNSMQPDLVWIKPRAASVSHSLYDSVRGAFIALASDTTNGDTNYNPYGVTSFNSNGFSLNDVANGGYRVNGSPGGAFSGASAAYVAWQWRASNAAGVTNTAGSITSTVSANTTAGFSIVTYTGTGANATVGHGLGVAPRMIICKNRASATDWAVYHASIGNTGALRLNLTAITETDSRYWNNTTPTSSVFSVGSSSTVNGSGNTQVAYCFAEVAGFSRFGSYTGNGSSDGTFVYTGFRPKYVMVKRTDSAYGWFIEDTARDTFNEQNKHLRAELSDAEVSGGWKLDTLSNGFKLRESGAAVNASGGTYIFMAFAENPFKYSLAR